MWVTCVRKSTWSPQTRSRTRPWQPQPSLSCVKLPLGSRVLDPAIHRAPCPPVDPGAQEVARKLVVHELLSRFRPHPRAHGSTERAERVVLPCPHEQPSVVVPFCPPRPEVGRAAPPRTYARVHPHSVARNGGVLCGSAPPRAERRFYPAVRRPLLQEPAPDLPVPLHGALEVPDRQRRGRWGAVACRDRHAGKHTHLPVTPRHA